MLRALIDFTLSNARRFYSSMGNPLDGKGIKYLIDHLPINNKLLRDITFLHPLLRDNQHGAQAIRRLAVIMPTISEEEVCLVTDEWKVYP